MGRQPIQILAICPYAGMDNVIRQVAASFDNLNVIFEYAELEEAIDVALQYTGGEVDAIVSRGGTAKIIAETVKIPTFDIGITTNDLINTIVLVRNSPSKKMCLVGFKEVTESSRYLERLLEREIPVYVTAAGEENVALMQKLKEENYELVIGDATAVRYARAEGINTIMIVSGEDSVRSCFERISKYFNLVEEGNYLLALQRKILKILDTTLFIVNRDTDAIEHSQVSSSHAAKIQPALLQEISVQYAQSFKEGKLPEKTVFEHEGESWLLQFKQDVFRTEPVVNVIWRRINRIDDSLKSLFRDISQVQYPFQVESLNAKDSKMVQAIADCRAFAERQQPVLIVGEPFSGRQALAHMLYNLSSFAKDGIFMIDVTEFDEESLKQIFEEPDAYLNNVSITLVIRNLQHADPKIARLFLQYVVKSELCLRCRPVFIFDNEFDRDNRELLAVTRFLTSSTGLKVLLIAVPSLRERQGDLLFLATLALGEACGITGKNCFGFDQGAQEFILSYPWLANLHELRCIIRQTVEIIDHDYITKDDLQVNIDKWHSLYAPRQSQGRLPFLTGTLEEIEQRIILAVLQEEKGNKTNTTKRLGISRNTLWRKLKDADAAAVPFQAMSDED